MNPKLFLMSHLLAVALVFLIALFVGISLIRRRLRSGYTLKPRPEVESHPDSPPEHRGHPSRKRIQTKNKKKNEKKKELAKNLSNSQGIET